MQIAELENSKFISVGSISKSYGNQGEVLIKIFDEDVMEQLENIDNPLTVFIQFEQIYTPFFIAHAQRKGKNGWVVRFTTISDIAHSEEIVGRNLYIAENPDESYVEDVSDLQDITSLIGYTVIDENSKTKGEIIDVIEYPSNICLNIKLSDSREVLVPFHIDLVSHFDNIKRELILLIPNGLI